MEPQWKCWEKSPRLAKVAEKGKLFILAFIACKEGHTRKMILNSSKIGSSQEQLTKSKCKGFP